MVLEKWDIYIEKSSIHTQHYIQKLSQMNQKSKCKMKNNQTCKKQKNLHNLIKLNSKSVTINEMKTYINLCT